MSCGQGSSSVVLSSGMCLDLSQTKQQYAVTKQLETDKENGEQVLIHCLLPDGTIKKLEIRSGFQVGYIKVKLSEEFGFSMNNVSLWLDGKMMLDPMSLADYPDIKPDQVTQITVKITE
eukprot:TRINITY_DN12306_c0_g2_i1.p2 TRINITY_DN12306_c0_g2~~TRINITY_DN12306_c0_g2_i1.p2  ORF type:complete len:119 (-),score=13.53 TRINITY_DN12306_c0_g2_i1:926-1282(-)